MGAEMTPSIALWVLATVIVPLIGWCFTMTVLVMGIRREGTKLLHMHEHADEFGFGTVRLQKQQDQERAEMRQLVQDNTRAMREVAHYIRWWIENQTGEKPPPPIPKGNVV